MTTSPTHIGVGYYYNVYDLGNGRVRKVEKGFFAKALYALPREKFDFTVLYRLLAHRKHITETYRRIRTVDQSLIGHPAFLSGLDYEQDKAVILEDALSSAIAAQQHAIIDVYTQHIITCWRHGFADTVFNFSVNNGIDKNGTPILLDFNEVTFDKEKVRHNIQTNRWLRAYSFTHHLPENLQHYYTEQMEKFLTIEKLAEIWGQKV